MEIEGVSTVADGTAAKIEQAVEEGTAEVKAAIVDAEQTEREDRDKLIEKIAQRAGEVFYDKTRQLIEDLLDATADAAEMVMADVEEAPAAEDEEAEPAKPEEQEEDVKPHRSHALFRKPMRKED
jgi:hypothetical protein